MAKKLSLKPRRIFSEAVRANVVKQIESGKYSISTMALEHGVSAKSVYNWINKYSRHLQSDKTMVVQMKSEATKTQELQQRIKELEAALGRKQMEVDFLNKMIDIGSEQLGIDLKKKLSTPPSTGTGPTNESTATK